MKFSKNIISLILMFTLIFSFSAISPISSSASTRGDMSKTRVLQIWTNKKGTTPKVILKQKPRVYKYKNWLGKTKTKDIYNNYLVTIKPVLTVDGKKTTIKTTTKWLDSSSEKISLKKGIYYEITIEPTAVPTKLPSLNGNYISASSWYLSTIVNCANFK